MKLMAALFICTLSVPAAADAVLMKNGERYIGEVTDLGNSLRVKNEAHPEGLEVKKSDVKTVYPKPEAMIAKFRADIEKAKARYEAGKNAADPNAEMKAALDLLFDPEVEAEDAIQIYPDFKKQFSEVQTSIHELRKLCRDAQVSGKPGPAEDPATEKPGPDPKAGDPPAGDPKGAAPQPPVNPDVLLLAPQVIAKPGEVEKAAKMMQARAAEHGFEGVTAKVVRRGDFQVVQMSCKDGMTPEMRKRLVWYGKWPGLIFEVRMGHCLSPGEAEQFPVPSIEELKSGKPKAPKGTKWHRFGEAGVVSVSEKHVITRKDFGKKQVSEEGSVYYEIANRKLADTLHADNSLRDASVTAGTFFIGDGGAWGSEKMCLIFEGSPGTRTWLDTKFSETDWKIVLNVLDRPLPFWMDEAK